MQIWRGLEDSKKFHEGVVTVGNFDGVHLGHQSLFAKASTLSGPRVVITFDPHPLKLLRPEKPLKRLMPVGDLGERLPAFATDLLVTLPFTPQLASLTADEFWQKYVREPFAPKHIVAGHDFAFGRGREGTLETLRAWYGDRLHVLAPLTVNGATVSSRRLRELIEAGEVASAIELLGRAFYLRGVVKPGLARGRTIGFPTLNMVAENETLPAIGVYATRTRIDGGPLLPSVTNVGRNPTVSDTLDLKIETHVLDRDIGTDVARIDVEFVARLRPEMKFASIEDLKNQIQRDILKARETLDGTRSS